MMILQICEYIDHTGDAIHTLKLQYPRIMCQSDGMNLGDLNYYLLETLKTFVQKI